MPDPRTPNPTTNDQKRAVAEESLRFVRDGHVVGLGTGSTATIAVRLLGERVKAGLKIQGIPTSSGTRELALQLGIPLTTLEQQAEIDVTIDGADEFDPKLNLIKGGGGALLREKVIASASKRLVIITDSSKRVQKLGRFPLPVEVIAFAQPLIAIKIASLGAKVKLRQCADGSAFVSDEGHHILDCQFPLMDNPEELAHQLAWMPGVVEHGLFIGMANVVLMATESAVQEFKPE